MLVFVRSKIFCNDNIERELDDDCTYPMFTHLLQNSVWESNKMFRRAHILVTFFVLLQYSDGQLENLGNLIQQQVQNSMQSINDGMNLGNLIQSEVTNSLAPLNDLGNKIQKQVETSLLPVKAMELKQRMLNGVGGTTVANYNSKNFIIQNGVMYECIGSIAFDGPKCIGTQQVFRAKSKQDFCYLRNYAQVNNYFCISPFSTGNVMMSSFNNIVKCDSNDSKNPPLLITSDEFIKMCGMTGPGQGVYTYYSNINDPLHVPIPNDNPYIHCSNTAPGICVFRGNF